MTRARTSDEETRRKERFSNRRVVGHRPGDRDPVREEGANVAINYRTGAEQALATQALIRAYRNGNGNSREMVVQTDVSDEQQVKRMFDEGVAAFGRVDVLVNNAGIQKPAPSHEIEAADFDRVIAVNLRGPFLCAREAIRHFLSRPGGGVILNNSSVHEKIPKPKYLPYSVSKGGLENLTSRLRSSTPIATSA